MPRKDAAGVVRVGIENYGQLPLLYELNKNQPLPAIIKDVCSRWNLDTPEQYALQYADNNNFITESNREEIRQGSVLRLTFSHSYASTEIANALKSNNADSIKKALEKLVGMSEDASFAGEFIRQDGIKFLVKVVETGTESSEILANSLTSAQELMEHGLTSWDVISPSFIEKVTVYVNKTTPVDPTILKRSLSILESAVSNSPSLHTAVESKVTFENLIRHIQSSNPEIQLNALSLINGLLLKTDPAKVQVVMNKLSSKGLRNMIQNSVIQGGKGVRSEMAHQLYIYQCLKLNLLQKTMMKRFDIQSETDISNLEKLRKIAFAMTVPVPQRPVSTVGSTRDFSKLGFKNVHNPSEDFMETPPGTLALDCMVYFANNHQEKYNQVVLENLGRGEEHQCPFARASITLIKMLCSLLRIGEEMIDTSQDYQPMFFTTDSPFEEFYSICIQVANKTWKEMKANQEDFKGVMEVVKEQIQRGLNVQEKHSTLEMFKNHIFQRLDFNKIMEMRISDGDRQDRDGLNSRPVRELRESIIPEVKDLVCQQRLIQLVEGSNFSKKGGHGSKGRFYCRLSPNHRFIHYGDCDENVHLPLEALPNKVPISDIKSVVTGSDCPHMKEKARKQLELAGRSFSLLFETEGHHLDFIAPNPQVYSVWIDGLSALLGSEMPSSKAQEDLDTLLNMDLKLRLLDLLDLNIKIPDTAPKIPPPPPNYDFYYPDVTSL